MRVTLLGTGAADGWPQPFCRCPSCEHARTHAIVRGRSGILIDDCVLLDPSPDVTTACARARLCLDTVSAVLVGHGHPDHLDPSLLLARGWAAQGGGAPASMGALEVHGPVSALDTVRPWVDPARLADGSVRLVECVVGREVVLPSGHVARAHLANHGLGEHGFPSGSSELATAAPEAVLWEVTSPDGARMLHAADTGPLSASTVASIASAVPLDLLLVEETFGDVADHGTAHLDLQTFPLLLAALRAAGAVGDSTTVVAVHLSHHNPPEPELVRRLAAWGVRPGRDLDVITVGATRPVPGGALTPARRTLVTGGARSGKSREAERLVAAAPRVTYVATSGPPHADLPRDAEWADRVARHRERRPAAWSTVETADVAGVVRGAQADGAVLVDCLTLWLTRVIDDADAWNDADTARSIMLASVADLVSALRATPARVVLVTNEVGSGIVPLHAGARLFRDLLGEVNSRVADACDEVLLTVTGRAIILGDLRTEGPL